MNLEREHDKLNELEQIRRKAEMLENEAKSNYNQTQQDYAQQRKNSEFYHRETMKWLLLKFDCLSLSPVPIRLSFYTSF